MLDVAQDQCGVTHDHDINAAKNILAPQACHQNTNSIRTSDIDVIMTSMRQQNPEWDEDMIHDWIARNQNESLVSLVESMPDVNSMPVNRARQFGLIADHVLSHATEALRQQFLALDQRFAKVVFEGDYAVDLDRLEDWREKGLTTFCNAVAYAIPRPYTCDTFYYLHNNHLITESDKEFELIAETAVTDEQIADVFYNYFRLPSLAPLNKNLFGFKTKFYASGIIAGAQTALRSGHHCGERFGETFDVAFRAAVQEGYPEQRLLALCKNVDHQLLNHSKSYKKATLENDFGL